MIYGDKEADEGSGASSCLVNDCKENPIIFKNIKNNLEYYNYFIPKNNFKEQTVKLPDYSAISQSCNLYTYCINNPMKYIDKDGESVITIVISIIILSGTLTVTSCSSGSGRTEVSSSGNAYVPNEFGYYGVKGNSADSSIRHMEGGSSVAWDFFNTMSNASIRVTDNGYKGEDIYGNIYYYRPTSSDGTAVVSINGEKGNQKNQKIHFLN